MQKRVLVALGVLVFLFLVGCQSTGKASGILIGPGGTDATGQVLVVEVDIEDENTYMVQDAEIKYYNKAQGEQYYQDLKAADPAARGMTHELVVKQNNEEFSIPFTNRVEFIGEDFSGSPQVSRKFAFPTNRRILRDDSIRLVSHEIRELDNVFVKVPVSKTLDASKAEFSVREIATGREFSAPRVSARNKLRLLDGRGIDSIRNVKREGVIKPSNRFTVPITGRAGAGVEICTNGVDDTGNGDIDCADATCANTDLCVLGSDLCNDLVEIIPDHNSQADENRIDIVFLAYDYDDMDRFTRMLPHLLDVPGSQKDVTILEEEGQRLFKGLFSLYPYSENVDKFNFWYIDHIFSGEVGTDAGSSCRFLYDDPDYSRYKNLLMQCNGFNENLQLAGIGEYTCTPSVPFLFSTNSNPNALHMVSTSDRMIFTFSHEFGHSHASIRDEYTKEGSTKDRALPPNCFDTVPELINSRLGSLFPGFESQTEVEPVADPGCSYMDDNVKPHAASIMKTTAGRSFGVINEIHMCEVIANEYGHADGCEVAFGQADAEYHCVYDIDHDNDGQVGCADSDCAEFLDCSEDPDPEVCTDGIDNDGDGAADCADSDCSSHVTCQEEICNNGIDDNGNGATDCVDVDCDDFLACQAEVCDNGVDDNGNGQVDCAESSCATHASCTTPDPEVCTDGIDNDGDGATDCDDTDCTTHASCQPTGPEICGNSLDDDGDGKIDCADTECTNHATCLSSIEKCDDGLDNDQDGDIDCEDASCINKVAGRFPCAHNSAINCIAYCKSTETVCWDGYDNDGNGLVDCADPQCVGVSLLSFECSDTFGVEHLCSDNFDNDGDGNVDCDDNDCAGKDGCSVITTNNPPALNSIGAKSTTEEVLLSFSVSGSDPDGDSITYSATNLPGGATFVGQAFSWTPTRGQAGSHSVTFSVSDGSLSDNEVVPITVGEAACLDSDSDGVCNSVDVCNGHNDNIDTDGDGQPDGCDACPLDAQNDADHDGVCGNVDACPGHDDTIDVDNDGTPDGCDSQICGNGVLEPGEQCDGGSQCTAQCTYLDSDGDGIHDISDNCPTVSNSQQDNFDSDAQGDVCDDDDDNDGRVDTSDCAAQNAAKWQEVAGYADTDGDGIAENGNGVIFCIGNSLPAGYVSAAGFDNCPEISNANQANSDGDDNGDACDICPLDAQDDADADGVCGNVDACPGYDDSSDGDGDGTADGCDPCPLHNPDDPDDDGECGVFVPTNSAPTLNPIGSKSVDEEELLSFSVSGSDSNDDSLTYSALNLPTGATFSGQTFSWTPTLGQAGGYSVTFSVSDGELSDSEVVSITVDAIECSDIDGDSICDIEDVCPGHNDNVDSDGDGTADGCDLCQGFDDRLDADSDGTPNNCDTCPFDAPNDSDDDGVCNSDDVCAGYDDRIDSDGDGTPDGCDVCPLDSPNDSDNDGFCDSNDMCPNFNDALDRDADGAPDGCDTCPDDNPNDSDRDGVCDSDDVCEGHNDATDVNGNGIPDGCDAPAEEELDCSVVNSDFRDAKSSAFWNARCRSDSDCSSTQVCYSNACFWWWCRDVCLDQSLVGQAQMCGLA